MFKRLFKYYPVVVLMVVFLLTSAAGAGAQGQSDGFARALDNLSRDISQSCKDAIEKSQDGSLESVSDSALSKLEDISVSEVKAFIENVNTPEQINYVIESVNSFASANKRLPYLLASVKTLKLLNEKARFLIAQNPGNKELSDSTVKISAAIKQLSSDRSTLSKNFVNDAAGAAVRKAGSQSKAPAASGGASKLKPGANFYKDSNTTTFALNAPRATSVKLVLFDSSDAKTGKEFEMKKTPDGFWYLAFNQRLVGKFYGYKVDGPKGPGEFFNPENIVSDPYAYANVGSAGKSVVVDTDFAWSDGNFKTPASNDIIVYEMHVKDYTAHASSGVAGDKRGKYLGLLEGETSDKVLGHLKDLGVNAVEILPVHEFDNKAAPSGVNHWGYMTTHFMAPESSYASGSEGQQVVEFKKLVNELHKNGIAVILDVVYNHTAEGNEQGPSYNFKGIDNKAYYRLCDDPRYYWNGTGCGNEFRTDSEMGRRYTLDTLSYWAKEYHVDGFRFDLATIIDKGTIAAIDSTLPKNIILIAEPWAADWNRNQWAKSDFRGTRWAKWNDDFKNSVKGLLSGKANRDNLMTVICGTCYWWTGKPNESVNFVECHDNATIMDFTGNNVKAAMLGGLTVLTSQGIPMLHEGQEFLKNKFGNDNSYDQDNDVNYINWTLKSKNKEAYEFFKGLIKIRMTFPQFRYNRPLTEKDIRFILVDNQNSIGYQLYGKDNDVIVLLNGDHNNWAKFPLPDDKDWTVLCNGTKVSLDGSLGAAKGDYGVPPLTGIILMKKK